MPTEEQINHLRHAVGHDPEAGRTLEQLLSLAEPPLDPITDASQALAAAREFQAEREFWIKPMEDPNLD
jgi:hypothetical protein